jgi:hypothetical protein
MQSLLINPVRVRVPVRIFLPTLDTGRLWPVCVPGFSQPGSGSERDDACCQCIGGDL